MGGATESCWERLKEGVVNRESSLAQVGNLGVEAEEGGAWAQWAGQEEASGSSRKWCLEAEGTRAIKVASNSHQIFVDI